MSQSLGRFLLIMVLTVIAAAIALPRQFELNLSVPEWVPSPQKEFRLLLGSPVIDFEVFGRRFFKTFEFRQGLDIQGGMQVVLEADMREIAQEDREEALQAARNVIMRRVDLYGIAEPAVSTARSGDRYRLLVDLPGVRNPDEALQLVGQTAQLEFMLLLEPDTAATESAGIQIQPTGLSGQQLKRSTVQFDPTTGEPTVAIEFDAEGTKLFADITQQYTGNMLGIFLDEGLLMAPRINVPIVTGQAIITGGFTLEEAKNLSIQLTAGALPVPIEVLSQTNIGATLGQESVQKSIQAGLIGLGLVMIFMVLYYGVRGVLASIALMIFAVWTLAVYKILGVTLTLPGIAGLLLTTGMAVDANILIFERLKEELRKDKPFAQAMEIAFKKAWVSIKDANIATLLTAVILINPLDLSFLNTSGMVRGFGITLLIGVLMGLITGVFVTRTCMRLFLQGNRP